jgi:phytoene synthase
METALPVQRGMSQFSGSNLAIALRVLPQSRRRDMAIFYAFCREVDDLADEPHFSELSRRDGLRCWREAISRDVPFPGEPRLAPALREVLRRHSVPREWVLEVVAGCEMDLGTVRYATWEDLRIYCYRVAGAVGLVSARIFGSRGCESYAVDLGLALQLTNILRDSAEDYRRGGRVYFPSRELEQFGVTEGAWLHGEPDGWSELMHFQHQRAHCYFESARRRLPDSERTRMVAAEIMRSVYEQLLERMRVSGFQVWSERYRLSTAEKVRTVAGVFLRIMSAPLFGFGLRST